ncbi:YlxR family protein [Antrihabitans cavernicola]|uniref:YlxR family protein n=1 Tax=Antrihabitans cavernicola TaxID=2495913 RepID=A0A5A7SAW4_9NOCA|nr:YlxR family protein [Spelaeibacter cavernicola]KAA0023290.1 YlxR family protein [Spelaeibacter cavernicola]
MVRHEPVVSVPSAPGSPVRTCIGCRERALTVDLLRVVARNGTGNDVEGSVVVPDPRCRLPGRGAWLHPRLDCLNQAERRRAFGRALRVSGHLDITALIRLIEPDRNGLVTGRNGEQDQ